MSTTIDPSQSMNLAELKFLTLREMAQVLRISIEAARDRLDRRELPFYRTRAAPHGEIRIRASDLAEYISRLHVPAGPQKIVHRGESSHASGRSLEVPQARRADPKTTSKKP